MYSMSADSSSFALCINYHFVIRSIKSLGSVRNLCVIASYPRMDGSCLPREF